MFKNYLTIALRNLLRHKLFSLINIIGLAIGLATCSFMFLYVADELSYDRFHPNASRTYQVRHSYFMGDTDYDWHETAAPLIQVMKTSFPEVEKATSITAAVPFSCRLNEKVIGGIKTIHADADFFEVFNFPLVAGSRQTALKDPNSIVISQQFALLLFGKEEEEEEIYSKALGKIISLDNEPYTITGIIKNPPAQSHIYFEAILPMSLLLKNEYINTTWLPAGIHNYVVLKEGVEATSLKSKFTQIEKKYLWPQLQKHLGASLSKLENNPDKYGYFLESILDIYLIRQGNMQYVYILSAVGCLILLLACANFITLSTAQSVRRAKEVALRKTIGSSRLDLIKQFLLEISLYILLAVVLAATAFALLQEPFHEFSNKNLSFNVFLHPTLVASFTGLILVVIILASCYPVFYLTSFRPIEVFKGNGNMLKPAKKSQTIRNILMIAQFCISIALMACSFVMYEQLHFMQEKDPGFTKENIIIIPNVYSLGQNKEAFKKEVSAQSKVSSISYSYAVPSSTFDALGLYKILGSDKEHQFYWMNADDQYLETYKMRILAGRNFSRNFPSDSTAVLLNKAAAQQLGIDNPVGLTIVNHFSAKLKVIGLVEDFNFEHMKNIVKPLVISLSKPEDFALYASVKVEPGSDISGLLKTIESQWKSFDPDAPFEYYFMDEKFNNLFHAERRLGNVMAIFTLLAVFIACLGLFGLATFTAEQRTKEIGIRKVLGASVPQIAGLLSRDFLKLVIFSLVIAIPLAWFAMHKWLENFAYRIDINFGVFILAGISALFIALFTVSFQSIKAALANPVKSLRNQ